MIALVVTQANKGRRLARRAKLIYVNDFAKGFQRQRRGKRFVYITSKGKIVKDNRTLQRIVTLAIPPAWEDVWICSTSSGHIQARGRDAEGRLQSIYHVRWHEISTLTKFDRMSAFAAALPAIRKRIDKDLQGTKLTRHRVLAAIVAILDKAHIRVGNERYAKERDSRGATTLTKQHVEVVGAKVVLDFPGKSGKWQTAEVEDRRVAKVVRQCEEIRGQILFRYLDSDGQSQSVSSSDVNDYLREASGDMFTAKDFRTWWGSVFAFQELISSFDNSSKTSIKRSIGRAVTVASQQLGNTKSVCRKSYIHPGLLLVAEQGRLSGILQKWVRSSSRGSRYLSSYERAFAAILPYLS